MSWMSPLTVPMTMEPSFGAPVSASSGRRIGHARLHGVGGQQHLRNEEDAVAEIDADDPHALDEGLREDLVGRPAAPEQDVGPLDDLFGETVIEILVHLLHEFIVLKGREIKIVVDVGHQPAPSVDLQGHTYDHHNPRV